MRIVVPGGRLGSVSRQQLSDDGRETPVLTSSKRHSSLIRAIARRTRHHAAGNYALYCVVSELWIRGLCLDLHRIWEHRRCSRPPAGPLARRSQISDGKSGSPTRRVFRIYEPGAAATVDGALRSPAARCAIERAARFNRHPSAPRLGHGYKHPGEIPIAHRS